MCINQFIPPNYILPDYTRQIKYPYSKLKKHHSHYLSLVHKFMKEMYNLYFYVGCFNEGIQIDIYDVNPSKIYNPFNFDASYRAKTIDGDITLISEYEFFETFFSYIPDIVPYLQFAFHFEQTFFSTQENYKFNLRDEYYKRHHRDSINYNNSYNNFPF